ncbi:ABC transporter substrate-binding protein [Paenibacillus sp. CC-CFT747]|nr:ABC transporter substrate-binding protein [Paenibacillus sp. CC-CFT747]
MKPWRTLHVLVIFLLAFALTAGCSGGKQGAGSSNEQKSGTTPNSSNQPAATNNTNPAKKWEGKLTIWTFAGQVEDMKNKFMEKYPGVTVDLKIFPGDQYQMKLLAAMQTGQDAPDIFDLERGYIGKFIDAPFAADLSAMGAEELVKDYVPYVQAMGRDKSGKLKGISDHSSPGGFWYIKENAKKYLGTDDPAKISEMVNSWDKVLELGKKVSAESGGKVKLISHYSDIFGIEYYNMQPFVKDGALVIDPKWKDTYENQKKIREADVDAKLGFLSAGWTTALNDGGVVLVAMPAWAGNNVDNKDNKANDKYGVAKTPKGWYKGGTYRSIYEKSKNKELAYEFIKFIASSEWQSYNLEKTGNMPSSLKVYDENLTKTKSPFFGSQNILQPYYEMMKTIPAIQPDKYGEDVFSKFKKAANDGIANKETFEQVTANFKKEVKNAYPELKVE